MQFLFLVSAHCLIMLYICDKIHENISMGFRVTEWTQKHDRQTDGWTDIWMDRQMDGQGESRPLQISSGRALMRVHNIYFC